MQLQNKPIYEILSKLDNEKMVKFRGKIFWGGILKKMKTYKMQLQIKPIYENSSKSDNGKVVKYLPRQNI